MLRYVSELSLEDKGGLRLLQGGKVVQPRSPGLSSLYPTRFRG